jgi:hypothetical protein
LHRLVEEKFSTKQRLNVCGHPQARKGICYFAISCSVFNSKLIFTS